MIGWTGLRREPFRLLFPLGAVFGMVGTGHWAAYAFGWTGSYSGFYHASIQLSAYLFCFIAGFLMTMLPRSASAPLATSAELGALLALLILQAAAASLGRWPAAAAAGAGLLASLGVFAARRFTRRQGTGTQPPAEFIWIPAGILMGLGGAVLFMAGQLDWVPASWLSGARPLAQQGFPVAVILGVGGFLAPRLMGTNVPSIRPGGCSPEHAQAMRRRRIRLHLAAAVALAASFALEGAGRIAAAYLLRAAVVTAELVWTTRCDRLPRLPELYLRVLWLSLWMVMLGFWAAGVWPARRVTMLHLVFLGGFGLMIYAVATMVVLSHGGAPERLQRPLWPLRLAVAGVLAALAARLAADFHPAQYFACLGAAAVSWIAGAAVWLTFALPYCLRTVSPEALERQHEEAKRRLQPGERAC